jgi:uncharacterized membrane protein
MKNVIDHAILIPVSAQAVWGVISKIENNPRWQVNCKSVVYLNALRGQGMRWRYQDASGREFVAEVTAWYDRIGFEYLIVDGVPYAENKGRIRLQETPDGTVVQWTFSYNLSGFLGGLRNALGVQRSIDQAIVESLRQLYRYARDSFSEVDPNTVKSTMRDAPNYEERASYKSRYGETATPAKPIAPVTPAPPELYARPTIAEPPPAEGDTKPNPAIVTKQPPAVEPAAQPPTATSAPMTDEPYFLKQVSEVPRVSAPGEAEPTSTPTTTQAQPSEPAPSSLSPIQPAPLPPQPTASAPITPPEQPAVPIISTPPAPKPLPDKRDTANISVFELFGLPKPSETQAMRAVTTEDTRAPQPAPQEEASAPVQPSQTVETALPTAVEEQKAQTPQTLETTIWETQETPIVADVTPFAPPRFGLRWILRAQLVKLRRPTSR